MSLLPNDHLSGMFIHAEVAIVEKCLVTWGNEEIVNRGTRSTRASSPLALAWRHVDMREPNPTRGFLIDLKGGWTGFFNNQAQQYLAAAELNQLCERLQTTTCFFYHNDVAESEHRGSTHFAVERWQNNAVVSRSVLLYRQSGWKFEVYGDALHFENVEAYQRKRKAERLTPELLRNYGEAMGVRFWDEAASGKDVVLLQTGRQAPGDSENALRKVLDAAEDAGLGKPSIIMNRSGIRRRSE